AARDRVFGLSLAEYRREVLLVRLEGAGADGLDRERSGGRVVTVGAQHQPEPLAQSRLWLWPQLDVASGMLGARPVVEDQQAFAMEPVGGPIGRHVAAVTPDRSNFHPSQCLPHGLAGADRAFRSDHLAVARDDALGNRGHVLVDAAAHP